MATALQGPGAWVPSRRRALKFKLRRSLIYVGLLLGAGFFVIPFIFMISTSLKTYAETVSYPPSLFPAVPQWSNYVTALTTIPFVRWLINSLILTLVPSFGIILSSSAAGYAFARLRFPGKNYLFVIIIATMMIPGACYFVPTYILWYKLHGIDTYFPFIIPAFCGNAFYIFLFRQFFSSIPKELDESAIIDGCSRISIYYKIILPLSKPALATAAIWTFQWSWNDFMGPLFFLFSREKFPLALGLAISYVNQQRVRANELVNAAALLFCLPLIVMFFVGQKYFIQGIVTTGIKG
ncbi:MAG: carbohydrate ABC transporter permease [Firmicutes bacterium]|nr:carbohydrate ABC transporter permease [Bacillota bacterium]